MLPSVSSPPWVPPSTKPRLRADLEFGNDALDQRDALPVVGGGVRSTIDAPHRLGLTLVRYRDVVPVALPARIVPGVVHFRGEPTVVPDPPQQIRDGLDRRRFLDSVDPVVPDDQPVGVDGVDLVQAARTAVAFVGDQGPRLYQAVRQFLTEGFGQAPARSPCASRRGSRILRTGEEYGQGSHADDGRARRPHPPAASGRWIACGAGLRQRSTAATPARHQDALDGD